MRTIISLLLLLGACAAPPTDAASAAPGADADRAVVREALLQSLSRAPANLQVREHADGGRHVHITGGFQHATMVVRGDAGVQRHCLTDVAAAMRLVEGKAAP